MGLQRKRTAFLGLWGLQPGLNVLAAQANPKRLRAAEALRAPAKPQAFRVC